MGDYHRNRQCSGNVPVCNLTDLLRPVISDWYATESDAAASVLLYAGMCLLQHEPEILNGFHSEPLTGKIRFYAVRMVRVSKMVVCLGFLIPSFFDILGKPMGEIFSVGMIVCVILVIAWHIFQIYRYNSGENHTNS